MLRRRCIQCQLSIIHYHTSVFRCAQFAFEGGASANENSKIRNGGASTIVNQRGARKTITRGVQMDRADFSNEDLSG